MAKVITRAVEYLKEEPVADTSTYIAKLNDYDRMKKNTSLMFFKPMQKVF